MKFSLGDILIKIDCRATAETQFTRHHVMLVLGTAPSGNPLVMHMMGAPHCKLVQEELKRGKDLTLISCAWTKETRESIQQAALISQSSNNFILTDDIIQEQRKAVSLFRPECHFESQRKLAALEAAFYLFETEKGSSFIPNPCVVKKISCHEWVLSTIHYACKQTKQTIPQALRIPPPLAWADRLYQTALNDEIVSCTRLKFLPISQSCYENKQQEEVQVTFKKNTELSRFSLSFFQNYVLNYCIRDDAQATPSRLF